MDKKAVVLLSGGLDSVTVLATAKAQGYTCYALSFDYGQRHNAELQAAAKIAADYDVVLKVIRLDLGSIGGSALTDSNIDVPQSLEAGIPVTYVPARNTVFLSLALGWAEVLKAQDIFIGVNAVDYSGYPDCRPEFIAAFENLANVATKSSVEGTPFRIHTPLISLTKAQIIAQGTQLGVNYRQTVSCYSASEHGEACGTCDACRLRKNGFFEAGIEDVTRYVSNK
ncbi:MAG: 7-cyano-7-deazaguanine synthase QueC [Pseudomonadota bacterium]|jgi:7-cyano-7-deazaguanine synthase